MSACASQPITSHLALCNRTRSTARSSTRIQSRRLPFRRLCWPMRLSAISALERQTRDRASYQLKFQNKCNFLLEKTIAGCERESSASLSNNTQQLHPHQRSDYSCWEAAEDGEGAQCSQGAPSHRSDDLLRIWHAGVTPVGEVFTVSAPQSVIRAPNGEASASRRLLVREACIASEIIHSPDVGRRRSVEEGDEARLLNAGCACRAFPIMHDARRDDCAVSELSNARHDGVMRIRAMAKDEDVRADAKPHILIGGARKEGHAASTAQTSRSEWG